MTAEQAADYAGVKVETIRTWANSGRVRAGRAGRELRFKASDVDAYLVRDPEPRPAKSSPLHPRVLEILGEDETH